MPFVHPEPSLGIGSPCLRWYPSEPRLGGSRYRAALEAIAYLMALAVQEHENAGQAITKLTVSGGIARSDLMCEILASVLNRPLERLASDEGPALGAAVLALCGLENCLRKRRGKPEPFEVGDAVHTLVRYREPVQPNTNWIEA